MRLILFLPLLLLATAPSAEAHIAHPPFSQVLELGPFQIAVTPVPSPIEQGAPVTFVLVDVQPDESRPGSDIKVRFYNGTQLLLERDAKQNGTIWETQPPVVFNDTGHVSLELEEAGGARSERYDFDVYQWLPFAFAPIDATSDPIAGTPYGLKFRTVDRNSSEPVDVLENLFVLRHPLPRHEDSSQVPPSPTVERALFRLEDDGIWATNVTFSSEGGWMLRLGSESANVDPFKSAPWVVDVLPAPETAASPVPIAVVLGGLAAVAFRRRKEKGG